MAGLYIIWDFDPEIINIFGFPLKYYGLLFACGLLLSMQILKRIFKNENLKEEVKALESTYKTRHVMTKAEQDSSTPAQKI